MTRFLAAASLHWVMILDDAGYTCLELHSIHLPNVSRPPRFAWIVNAPATGWAAHLGPWDGGETTIPKLIEHFDNLGDAQTWAMSELAAWWKQEAKARRE